MTTVPAQGRIAWVCILVAAVFVLVWVWLKPSDMDWNGYAFELAIWAAVALVLAAGLLALLWKAHDFLNALGDMWRPIGVLLLAGAVLLVDDQGRDLGVSLLSENRLGPILFLFFALLYWAANTWHSAQLGLSARVATGAALATADRAAQALAGGGEKPTSADRSGVAPIAEPLEKAAWRSKTAESSGRRGNPAGRAQARSQGGRTLALLATAPPGRFCPSFRSFQSVVGGLSRAGGSVGLPRTMAGLERAISDRACDRPCLGRGHHVVEAKHGVVEAKQTLGVQARLGKLGLPDRGRRRGAAGCKPSLVGLRTCARRSARVPARDCLDSALGRDLPGADQLAAERRMGSRPI